MTTWTDGYVQDLEYSSRFYPELSPVHLNFAVLGQGMRPLSTGEGATYCELGCGQGLGTVVVAAAHPRMRVWGIDFNPAHIANAQRLASKAALDNVTFTDHSFEQLLALPVGSLPSFDYITLHGVYSWISPENRRFIVAFIDRHLKPGGLIYVSYNCLPGWSPLVPLQRLLHEHALRHPDRSDLQMQTALNSVKELIDAEARFFKQNPAAGKHVEAIPTSGDMPYLVHEYLNEHFHPLFHLDVAREMEAARLSYVASANIVENFDGITLPRGVIALIEESRDDGWRETLRDYARNQAFRRDIYMRGAARMPVAEQLAQLGDLKLVLLVPRELAKPSIATYLGEAKTDEATCLPILDALAQRPHTIRELIALPALRGKFHKNIIQEANLLIHSRQVLPMQTDDGQKAAAVTSRSLNKAIAERLAVGDILNCIAVPGLGTGVKASLAELLLMHALASGVPEDARKIAEFGWSVMKMGGRRFVKDGKTLETQDENVALLEMRLGPLLAGTVPIWKSLGVI